jgi:hypothetical protein
MSYGYSAHIIQQNKKADASSLGVMLGKFCITTSMPVTALTEKLGISRQTAYNWFVGKRIPHPRYHAAINKLLKRRS